MNIEKNHIFAGLLAGLLGGLFGAFILWGSWLLPVMGLILTRVSILQGMLSMLILGLLGGGLYALIMGRERRSLSIFLGSGLLLGLLLWFFGALLIIPLLLGLEPLIHSPLDHSAPFVALLLYGLIVGLVYYRFMSGSRKALSIALSILVLSIILVPLMLRAAISTHPKDLSLREGFRAQVVAKGFTYPTSLAFDDQGNIYVAEAGFAYGPKSEEARIVVLDERGATNEVASGWNGPINGLEYREGILYISHKGAITALNLEDGTRRDLVTGLPSEGDHQNNDLVFGGDGALYFGQGTATNAGVVGSDNALYGWLEDHLDFHDVPSSDFLLTGESYEDLDVLSLDPTETAITGAYAPFGERREEGEEVLGEVKASGVILRFDLEEGNLSIFAHGIRNPYGLALGPEDSLYASNLGYDDRGVRAIQGSPDWLLEIKEGGWYGWPDYAGSVPLSAKEFQSERGVNRKPLLADPPPVEPPFLTLPSHISPMKLDMAPLSFPEKGLFVALFGDGQPLTEDLEEVRPSGVIQVDLEGREYEWFVKNEGDPRAGRWGGGFKRVIDVKFHPHRKELYILDFGVMEFTDLSPNAIPNSGVLWKIIPEQEGREERIPPAREEGPRPEERGEIREEEKREEEVELEEKDLDEEELEEEVNEEEVDEEEVDEEEVDEEEVDEEEVDEEEVDEELEEEVNEEEVDEEEVDEEEVDEEEIEEELEESPQEESPQEESPQEESPQEESPQEETPKTTEENKSLYFFYRVDLFNLLGAISPRLSAPLPLSSR